MKFLENIIYPNIKSCGRLFETFEIYEKIKYNKFKEIKRRYRRFTPNQK